MVSRDYKRSGAARGVFRAGPGLLIGLVAGSRVGFALYFFEPRTRRLPAPAEARRFRAEPASARDSAVDEPAERYDFYQMLPNFEVVVPEKEVVVPRDAPETVERKGAYVLQAGSYKQVRGGGPRAGAARAAGHRVERAAASRSTATRGIACGSGRSADLEELNRVRNRLREAEVDFLVVKVGD